MLGVENVLTEVAVTTDEVAVVLLVDCVVLVGVDIALFGVVACGAGDGGAEDFLERLSGCTSTSAPINGTPPSDTVCAVIWPMVVCTVGGAVVAVKHRCKCEYGDWACMGLDGEDSEPDTGVEPMTRTDVGEGALCCACC